MSRPRCFTLTALRDLPEVGLAAGDVIRVDRGTIPAVMRVPGDAITDPDRMEDIARLVFRSRARSYTTSFGPPAFAVTPSYRGAQWTLENIAYSLRGGESGEKKRGRERRALRAAVRAALAAPLEAAPQEPHAAALLGTEGYHRLTRSLAHIRQEPAV